MIADIREVSTLSRQVIAEVERAVVGKRTLLEMIVAAALAGGHVLLEDYPGLGKTLAARSFAAVLGLDFKRIQFTPDLLPGDITGGYIFNRQKNRFELRKGPLFANIILADEINRASPKTQSALLEAMQEGQVTLEGETLRLPEPFLVLATQNPIEYEGTFPLPEAQLDRFMLKLSVGYPSVEEEKEILRRRRERRQDEVLLRQITDAAQIMAMRQIVESVHVEADLEEYIAVLVNETRQDRRVAVGASPRASLAFPEDGARPRRAGGARVRHPRRPQALRRAGPQPPHYSPAGVLDGAQGDRRGHRRCVRQGAGAGDGMTRTLLLSLLAYGLILTGLTTLRGELLALALPFVLYLLIGLWRAPDEVCIEVARKLSAERLPLNMPVAVTLTVTNAGRGLEEVLVEDELPPALKVQDGFPRRLLTLPAGASLSWTYTVSGARGCYPFAAVRVTAQDHFGLIQRQQTFEIFSQLFILPPLLRLRRVAIRPRQTRVYSGTIPARQGGPGVEFFGVREYQTGDSPHWINWRASARHPPALFSNEFEQERVADVGIVLDGRQRANILGQGYSLFEHSVLAAAALADAFLTAGNRVSLLLYGQYLHWTLPGYGRIQRERILQALARAAAGESSVFAHLGYIPTRLFPAHSQVVLISPLTADDLVVLVQLRSRGYQVLVISPDPLAFERAHLSETKSVALAARILRMERALLLQKLQRAGVQVLDWDVALPFDQVVHAALSRSPAWLRAIGR